MPAGAGLQVRDTSLNSAYYREVGDYTVKKNLTQRFAFAVINGSSHTLMSPRLEVVIETPDFKLDAFDVDSFPDEPDESVFASNSLHDMMEKQSRQNHAVVKQNTGRTIIRADLENIQAKRTAWSSSCFLGTSVKRITLQCQLYADNLKQPFHQQLTLNFSITEQSKTLKQWIASNFTATPVN